MKKLRIIGIILLLALLFACKTVSAPNASAADNTLSLARDSAVLSGKLDNGMNYLVMKNGEPSNRIYLRLAIKAGSILENDDQKGVAHLVEHMAFNETEHFAKNDLIDYFESIGMSFGPEINAYTGFDETVYMLEIPADDPAILQKSLLVLQDWAKGLTFDPAELDKERGVVLEEWRLGRGANGRVQDKQIPFIFNGSRYGERLPIGNPEIVKTVSRERVKDFYTKWYRPELMSVILVGDADPAMLIRSIKDSLGTIPRPTEKQKHPTYKIEGQKKAGVLVFRDPEIAYTTIQILEQYPSTETKTASDVRRQLVQTIGFSVFNKRLEEKTLIANPQMLAAQAGLQRIAKPTQFSFLGMVPSNENFTSAFKQLIEELMRMEQFGVTEAELAREKQSILDDIKQTWLEKEKLSSANRAGALVQDALYDEAMISIQDRYDLYNKIVPEITVDEILKSVQAWYTGRGKLLLVTASEKASDIPDDATLLSLWQTWKPETSVTVYQEKNLDRPLYDTSANAIAGSVVKEETISKSGIKQWTLSNGATVIVYPTNFKANEILFSAYSKGGSSLVSDAEFPSVSIATSFTQMSGLNGFSAVDLQKKLAGKTVSAGSWIDESWEGLYGSSSVADLETLFQLVNLGFTKPYFTDDAYQALIAQLTTVTQTRLNQPEEVFSDLKIKLLYDSNIRKSNLSEALVAAMDRSVAEKSYRERFADAGDFTFAFVGSFDEAQLKKLVETYLAVLPGTGKQEEARHLYIAFPAGITEDTLKMGIEAKSRVFISFGGSTTIEKGEFALFNSLCALLDIKLREVIREDLSGSYGVQLRPVLSGYPDPSFEISIEFGCEPGREESLSASVLEQITLLRTTEVSGTYITKLRENVRRSQEEGLKNNQFLIGRIIGLSMQGRSLDEIEATDAIISLITPESMQETAKKYFNTDNYVRAYLMPKK